MIYLDNISETVYAMTNVGITQISKVVYKVIKLYIIVQCTYVHIFDIRWPLKTVHGITKVLRNTYSNSYNYGVSVYFLAFDLGLHWKVKQSSLSFELAFYNFSVGGWLAIVFQAELEGRSSALSTDTSYSMYTSFPFTHGEIGRNAILKLKTNQVLFRQKLHHGAFTGSTTRIIIDHGWDGIFRAQYIIVKHVLLFNEHNS